MTTRLRGACAGTDGNRYRGLRRVRSAVSTPDDVGFCISVISSLVAIVPRTRFGQTSIVRPLARCA